MGEFPKKTRIYIGGLNRNRMFEPDDVVANLIARIPDAVDKEVEARDIGHVICRVRFFREDRHGFRSAQAAAVDGGQGNLIADVFIIVVPVRRDHEAEAARRIFDC